MHRLVDEDLADLLDHEIFGVEFGEERGDFRGVARGSRVGFRLCLGLFFGVLGCGFGLRFGFGLGLAPYLIDALDEGRDADAEFGGFGLDNAFEGNGVQRGEFGDDGGLGRWLGFAVRLASLLLPRLANARRLGIDRIDRLALAHDVPSSVVAGALPPVMPP